MIIVMGRGHSGTRLIAKALEESGVFMGHPLNESMDYVKNGGIYHAVRLASRKVKWVSPHTWDFSGLSDRPPEAFYNFVESHVFPIMSRVSKSENAGWKLPETILGFPWFVSMFPDAKFIHWTRDPRDATMGKHGTDDLSMWDVPCDPMLDGIDKRMESWIYQENIVRLSPVVPENLLTVRFEDMVNDQVATRKRLSEFLGIPIVKVRARKAPVGRWHDGDYPTLPPQARRAAREYGYDV